MLQINDIISFCNERNYDLRISGNARWIDQKCTPDVLWSISDFVINYVDNINPVFKVKDIWNSEYARLTIAETYSKPGTDNRTAENEYDKVFSQPLCLLCYAGIIQDISTSPRRHLYKVVKRDILEYIATNDIFALRFLQVYIEKVLRDSDLYGVFEKFFTFQDKTHFNYMKTTFINFYHTYTPVQKDYEPARIFTKVINPLAHKYRKLGSDGGYISKNIIVKSDLMYNRDNFRDIYSGKPKDMSREEWLRNNPTIDVRMGYFEQMLNHSKALIRDNILNYRNNISELTQFSDEHNDVNSPTQIHHIFPKNEFPEIKHYIENLIALTPNQHYGFAHPNNNTQIIDIDAQKILLLAKTYSIRQNLTTEEEKIYDFASFLYVLRVGWDDEDVLTIKENDYLEVVRTINVHYATMF